MKKSIVILMFLSLMLASCAGTKYTSAGQATPVSDTTKKPAPIQNSGISSEDLENVYQEDIDFSGEYREYTGNYAYFTFELADHIIETATDNLGVKYKYGGTNKSGFDCSGLVYTSFKKFDVSLPRSSSDMAEFGQRIRESEAQKGDLIFFITNGGRRINHVGIITEVLDDEIKFIHSSTSLGVIISSTKEAYYKKNFVKVARVL